MCIRDRFDINLDAQEGDTVVLLGPSGAGKSTLIRTLNLLEVPTSGELHIANNHFDLSQANNNPKAIRQLRQDVGMVFQQYNLCLLYTSDGRLSGDGSIQCHTCHQLDKGGVDRLETSTGIDAVSYTHLDVYKRQTLNTPKNK